MQSGKVTANEYLIAAENGDAATVNKYISENQNNSAALNVVNPSGDTALLLAIYKKHTGLALNLIPTGIDPFIANNFRDTALIHAYLQPAIVIEILPRINHISELLHTSNSGASIESLTKTHGYIATADLIEQRKKELIQLSLQRLTKLSQRFNIHKSRAFLEFDLEMIKKDITFFNKRPELLAETQKQQLDEITTNILPQLLLYEDYSKTLNSKNSRKNLSIDQNENIAMLAMILQQPSAMNRLLSLETVTLKNITGQGCVADLVCVFRHTRFLRIECALLIKLEQLIDHLSQAKTIAAGDATVTGIQLEIESSILNLDILEKLRNLQSNTLASVSININGDKTTVIIGHDLMKYNALRVSGSQPVVYSTFTQLMNFLPSTKAHPKRITLEGYSPEQLEISDPLVTNIRFVKTRFYSSVVNNICENVLKKLPAVQKVKFEAVILPEDVVKKTAVLKKLVTTIVTLPNLQSIELIDCGLTDQEFEILIPYMAANPNLTTIDLSKNNFSAANQEKLQEVQQLIELKVIYEDLVTSTLPGLETRINLSKMLSPGNDSKIIDMDSLSLVDVDVAKLIGMNYPDPEAVATLQARYNIIYFEIIILKLQNFLKVVNSTNEVNILKQTREIKNSPFHKSSSIAVQNHIEILYFEIILKIAESHRKLCRLDVNLLISCIEPLVKIPEQLDKVKTLLIDLTIQKVLLLFAGKFENNAPAATLKSTLETATNFENVAQALEDFIESTKGLLTMVSVNQPLRNPVFNILQQVNGWAGKVGAPHADSRASEIIRTGHVTTPVYVAAAPQRNLDTKDVEMQPLGKSRLG